jgi:hypothetical protein
MREYSGSAGDYWRPQVPETAGKPSYRSAPWGSLCGSRNGTEVVTIPRWWWPPGDPWTDRERATLVEEGLLELALSAAAIPMLGKEAAAAVTQDLERRLAERLYEANDQQILQSIEYLISLGGAVRAHLITAAYARLRA